jgi:hypothetical protein
LKIDAPFCIERSLSEALFRPITRVNGGQLVLYLPCLQLLLQENNMQLLSVINLQDAQLFRGDREHSPLNDILKLL